MYEGTVRQVKMNVNSKTLALFDFDGTLTRKDSFIEFIFFSRGTLKAVLGLIILSPIIVSMKVKLLSRSRAKEIMFSYYFKGMEISEFTRLGMAFVDEALNSIVRPSALKRLNEHRTAGDRIIVVTASAYEWVKPWTNKIGVELIATKWAKHSGRLTGKLEGRNCNGEEKVKRLREVVSPESFEAIYAYGDTSGDQAMLAIATHKHYRLFTD